MLFSGLSSIGTGGHQLTLRMTEFSCPRCSNKWFNKKEGRKKGREGGKEIGRGGEREAVLGTGDTVQ